MTARTRRVRRVPQVRVIATGGPYAGRRIGLGSGSLATLVFCVHGFTGHYSRSVWTPAQGSQG